MVVVSAVMGGGVSVVVVVDFNPNHDEILLERDNKWLPPNKCRCWCFDVRSNDDDDDDDDGIEKAFTDQEDDERQRGWVARVNNVTIMRNEKNRSLDKNATLYGCRCRRCGWDCRVLVG